MSCLTHVHSIQLFECLHHVLAKVISSHQGWSDEFVINAVVTLLVRMRVQILRLLLLEHGLDVLKKR